MITAMYFKNKLMKTPKSLSASLFKLISKKNPPRGQSAVEFALIVPVIALSLTLIMDSTNLVISLHKMNAALREGNRVITESYATPDLTNCSINGERDCFKDPSISGNICCIALSHSNYAAFRSGLRNYRITGAWEENAEIIPGQTEVFFNQKIEATIPFLFGLAPINLEAKAVSYADQL